ncbi:MAG: hypothetical protein ACREEM_32220 [Blastocatellia bacterium]
MTTVTIEQVEQLATQLPAAEQLKLLARISAQLSDSAIAVPTVDTEAERQARAARAQALMQELDAIADSIEIRGESDAVEDLRQMREERAVRI